VSTGTPKTVLISLENIEFRENTGTTSAVFYLVGVKPIFETSNVTFVDNVSDGSGGVFYLIDLVGDLFLKDLVFLR